MDNKKHILKQMKTVKGYREAFEELEKILKSEFRWEITPQGKVCVDIRELVHFTMVVIAKSK